jgi:hypothetical protein
LPRAASSTLFSRARSFRLALRMADAMNGATMREPCALFFGENDLAFATGTHPDSAPSGPAESSKRAYIDAEPVRLADRRSSDTFAD